MINLDTQINIKGRRMPVRGLVEFANVEEEQCVSIANILIKQGKASIVENTTDEEDFINKALKAYEKIEVVQELDDQRLQKRLAIREENLNNTERLGISLDFDTVADAKKTEVEINQMNILNTEISLKNNNVKLIIKDITPQEYSKIARSYKASKMIDKSVDFVDASAKSLTDGINYATTNVIAPITKIGAKAGMNIGKGLIQTGVKIGAGIVTSGAKSIKETKASLQTDEEVLRATVELKEAKNSALSFFRRKLDKAYKTGSGISRL